MIHFLLDDGQRVAFRNKLLYVNLCALCLYGHKDIHKQNTTRNKYTIYLYLIMRIEQHKDQH